WGSLDAAMPLGREIAGTPALLQGAQKEPSPVEPSPAGAGAGAVGDRSASCASRRGMASSRNASLARLALTYAVAVCRSPVSIRLRISRLYWWGCLANAGA